MGKTFRKEARSGGPPVDDVWRRERRAVRDLLDDYLADDIVHRVTDDIFYDDDVLDDVRRVVTDKKRPPE